MHIYIFHTHTRIITSGGMGVAQNWGTKGTAKVLGSFTLGSNWFWHGPCLWMFTVT